MKNISKYKYIICCMMVLAASACETKYGSALESSRGGYVDRKIGDNEYEIQVTGNGMTEPQLLESYFHKRAKELCEYKKYDYNLEKDKQVRTSENLFSRTQMQFPMITGTVKCKP